MTDTTATLAEIRDRADRLQAAWDADDDPDATDTLRIQQLESQIAADDSPRLLAAVEAVLSQHTPHNDDGVTYCGLDRVGGCGQAWPCDTVNAITAALTEETRRG